MDLIDIINQKIASKNVKIVVGQAPEKYKSKKDVVAYIRCIDLGPETDKDLGNGIIILANLEEDNYSYIYKVFPIKDDSIFFIDWKTRCKLPKIVYYAPSLSKYRFPSNPELMKKLESVAKDINDAIRYDFKKFYSVEMKEEPDKKEAILEWMANAPYKPTGNETREGICADAGELIRHELKKFSGLKFMMYLISKKRYGLDVSHNVTFVYNPKTLEWAVLNSKSPYAHFNVFPKEALTKENGFKDLKSHFEID